MFAYWVGCSLASALLVYLNACRLARTDDQHSAINIRKHFHIFALAVFMPGMLLDKQMLMVAASCAIIVFIMLEVCFMITVPARAVVVVVPLFVTSFLL